MGRHTLVKAVSSERSISLRTVSRTGKSPHRFYILRDDLAELENVNTIIVQDLQSFAVLRRKDHTGMLRIEFSWIKSNDCNVSGFQNTVEIPYGGFMEFVRSSSGKDRPVKWKALSANNNYRQPRIVFKSRKNLHEAVKNRTIRKKLVRCLRDRFRWPGAERIEFHDDLLPYSFVFHKICEGETTVCGGLILHLQQDLESAYYEIHT